MEPSSAATPLVGLPLTEGGLPAKDLIDLYYLRFHSAHPILVPQRLLPGTVGQYPAYLETVMQYIGSIFLLRTSSQPYRTAAESVMLVREEQRDGHTVQAMLLFAIVLHASNEQEYATHVIRVAVDIALRLGMNRKGFACANSKGDAVLEESWRRTWFELYVVNALMAAAHQAETFELYDVDAEVGLPCEEAVYTAGQGIPKPHTVAQFHNRALSSDDIKFSSFSYRIDAVRILGSLMYNMPRMPPDESSMVEELDATLVGWSLHLPASKREAIDREGNVDEMLFQANMIVNTSLIMLHRPRSDLVFANVADKTECTPPRSFANPISSYHIHSAKAIRAASGLSSLVTLPTSLLNHTPFFSCAIALGAIVHLSAYVTGCNENEARCSMQRIRLAVGALKTSKEVWPIAGTLFKQIKELARDAFVTSHAGGLRPVHPPSQSGINLSEADDAWLNEFVGGFA
ncbi:MAG: hypothetical protein M1838_001149 [Thelocarpon superellum]|nr:MAG: hypothetical protein M1838_001149 [Thelocarpon superellum]